MSSEKVSEISPIIDRVVDKDSHLMSDNHRSYVKIGRAFAAHSRVTHYRGEYSRGDVHSNTAESFSALLERARQGVFHYISKWHLFRYLNEISFRWDNRVPAKKVTKKVMKPIPVIDMLIILIMRFSGIQLRRTQNGGIRDVNATQLAG